MESVKGLRKFFNQKTVSMLVIAALVLVVFNILSGGVFLRISNIRTILNLMSVTGFLTLGVGCLIVSGKIDLSTGATGTLCGILMAIFLQAGLPWPVSVVICLVVGMLVGAFTATFVNVFNIPPFIATMSVATMMNGLAFVICDGKSVPMRDEFLKMVGSKRILEHIPIIFLVMLVFFIIYGLMLSKTKFGRSIYLVGGNQQAARLTGINPVRISYILFMNSGMLSSLGGMMLAARLNSGTTNGTTPSQFAGIMAAMLGGMSFGGGSGSFAGVFIGLLIINAFNNGLMVIGVLPYWQTFASGLLLLFALVLDYINGRRIKRRVALG